jgi:DNA-binding NarL/FixJ family response regulator/predicted Ser/Thr protein kinase
MIGRCLGHYEIIGKLGEGARGVVYRAKDLQLERQVALKLLPAEFAEDPERVASLEREARLLASLNHPNISQIYGFLTSDPTRALVMELVEGPTLDEVLEGGKLPLEDLRSIAIQIVQALTAAHDQGIVHRDLKPQNIKLAPGGQVKVLDFGLARRQRGGGALLGDLGTLSIAAGDGIILGTVGYMAPEQVRGESVDTRADIFSFGCVLYEMVTGKRAFARSSAIETLSAILHDKPEAPSRHRHQLPASLDRVIARCLEKDCSARFQSARDLDLALNAFVPVETVRAVRPRMASVAAGEPSNPAASRGETKAAIPDMIRVLTVDDHPLLREGIGTLVNAEADMKVVAEASSGEEAIEQFRKYHPEVTLMDIQMPRLNGIEAIRQIQDEFANARIIVLTTYACDAQVIRALRAGARAYVLKGYVHRELLSTIRAVHAGQKRIPSEIAAVLAEHATDEELTAREIDILRLIAAGNSNKQVAGHLSISEATVKTHMTSILTKLQANDRTHALAIALQRGIIVLDSPR